MSETPDVPQHVTDDNSSKDHKEPSSPSLQEEAQVKACCKYGRPQNKERNLPAADTSDISSKQGQGHLAEGGESSHQHSPTVTSNEPSDLRRISSDQRQARKASHPDDQEGSSHTHQHGRHSSDHGRPGVLFSVRHQEQEGRKLSSKSDHKDRKVHGTSREEKEGRRPSRTSQDQDGRKSSKSSVHSDKEGRRSSRTDQGQDGRRRSSGTGHHGRKVSGAGHEHHHHIAAEAASGLEVMADLGHSKDKPHHHAANEFKKGGWDRLNAL